MFWLIDGILQLQPAMFTHKFIDAVIAPNLAHQPVVIQAIISFGITIFKINMPVENFLFAFIQILIGFLLLLPVSIKIQKAALWVSIFWSLVIWVLGEGLGGLLTGSASFYTGAPGAVLLYLIIATFLLFPKKFSLTYLPKALGLLCIFGGILNAFPMFWTKEMQSMPYQMSQADGNRFIAFPSNVLSHIVLSPIVSNGAAVVVLLILGSLLFFKPSRRIGYIMFVFLFFVWWISQDFGGIFTFPNGTATDPNTAPLFMLFLLPLFLTTKKLPVS